MKKQLHNLKKEDHLLATQVDEYNEQYLEMQAQVSDLQVHKSIT